MLHHAPGVTVARPLPLVRPRRRLRRRRPKRRHPVRAALIAMLMTVLTIGAGAAGIAWYVEHRLTSQLGRIDAAFPPAVERPEKAEKARDAVNILLLGTDLRSEEATSGEGATAPLWMPGQQRADTIMLLHIDADRRGATLVSIPRDAWVPVPGHGEAKINAAFSWGGPHLTVQTVEALTGVWIDHLAVVDWSGFAELTDAAGGVTVSVPETVRDSARGITWTAGEHRLDGEQALLYVRQRYGLPGGDLDRVRRQQVFLRRLLEASLHAEMRKDPAQLYDFLETVTQHVSVDEGWSVNEMRRLVFSLRNLRTAQIRYVTAPVRGFGWEGMQSVVYLEQRPGLWKALREDSVEEWAEEHPEALTEPIVR